MRGRKSRSKTSSQLFSATIPGSPRTTARCTAPGPKHSRPLTHRLKTSAEGRVPQYASVLPTFPASSDRTHETYLSTLEQREPDFEVCAKAENGRMAIEEAQESHPDLILLDLSMPVMNGLDARAL